jgi:hypothetical protein
MLKEDFVIQSNVRRILIRSGIDYSGITFGTVKGVVYLGGVFKLAGFFTDASTDEGLEFMVRNLRALERKIRSIPGVNDVVFEFTNWKKEKAQWTPKKVEEKE